jgi:hypothetical protein
VPPGKAPLLILARPSSFDGSEIVVMITIEMQIHDEKRFEEITEFLGSEIVMRQL